MHLTLPYPPTVNTYYRHVGSKTLISKAGRDYRQAVIGAVLEQRPGAGFPADVRLSVHVAAWMPDKRRRDLDNLPKAILDSLQHAGVFEDDSQVDVLLMVRMPAGKNGRVDVDIREVSLTGEWLAGDSTTRVESSPPPEAES